MSKLNKKIISIIGILLIVAVVAFLYFRNISGNGVSGPTITRIKESGKLVVATDATYPPMEYVNENKEIVGYDIDVAKEIADSLDVELEIKNVAWDNIFDTLRAGEVDLIISSVTIKPERAKTMRFSNPYFNAGQIIIVSQGNTDIASEESLDGKKIGVQEKTTSEEEALKLTSSDKVISYADYTITPEDLLGEKLDAIIIDYPAGKSLVKDNPGLKIVGEPFTDEFYGVASHLDNIDLSNFVNSVISKLKRSNYLSELEDTWL